MGEKASISLGFHKKHFAIDATVGRQPFSTYLKLFLDKLGKREVIYVIW